MEILNDDGTIHVAISIWDPKGNYSRHAGAAMASIMMHTKSSVCFHILHDETLNDENKNNLAKTAEKFRQNINFINMSIPQSWGLGTKHTRRWTPAVLFRLLLPYSLNVDKVIHIDCDIFFTMDILNLWEFISDEHAMTANFSGKLPSEFSLLGTRLRCCGYPLTALPGGACIALNLKVIREMYPTYQKDLDNFFLKCKDVIKAYDETFFGIEFAGDIKSFTEEFKDYTKTNNEKDIDGKIFHLYGKPWDGYMSRADSAYWDSLKETPWGENIMPYIYEAMNGEYNHRHTSSCVKKLLRQLGHDASIGICKLWNIAYCNIRGMIAR